MSSIPVPPRTSGQRADRALPPVPSDHRSHRGWPGRRGVAALTTALVLGLAACGGSGDDSSSSVTSGGGTGPGDPTDAPVATTTTEPIGEASDDERIRIVEHGISTFPDPRDGVSTSAAGVVLANVSDEVVTDIEVTMTYRRADGSKIGASAGTIGAIEPGGIGHVGSSGHRTKEEPASLEITVVADPTPGDRVVVPFEVLSTHRDDAASLNSVSATVTNEAAEEVTVALWCVVRDGEDIVGTAQNTMVRAPAGETVQFSASSMGAAADSAECSASTVAG